MKLVVTTIFAMCFMSLTFGNVNEDSNEVVAEYILARSISEELVAYMRSIKNKDDKVCPKQFVQEKLKAASQDKLVRDIREYADVFYRWSHSPVPHFDMRANEVIEVVDLTVMERGKILRQLWYGGTEPIEKYSFVITLQMAELARRRYTQAAPYFRQIAEIVLPKELDASMIARIKSKHQNPASEAWVALKMPEGLDEDEKTTWLNAFIESEKKLGDEGKMWAIEAAERMLRQMEREKTEPGKRSLGIWVNP